MLDFVKKSNTTFAISRLTGLLIAFLFFATVSACDSSSPTESVKLGGAAATFTTTTNLHLEGITIPVTLRVTITKDGSETVVDEIHNYDEDWIHSTAGTVPIAFTEEYQLTYDPHSFAFKVYYCETPPATTEELDTAITTGDAVLLGEATSELDVAKNEENLPLLTINIGTGDQVSGTVQAFFPSEPVFHAETMSTSDYCASGAGQYSSLALDSNGDAHISFLCQTSSATTLRLGYVFQTDGSWGTPWLLAEDSGTGIANTGQYSALAIDSEDGAHISYYDSSNHASRYVYVSPEDTAFASSVLIADGTAARTEGKYSSITVFESSGDISPYLVYWGQAGGTNSSASVAHDLAAWVIFDIPATSVNIGKFPTILFDNADTFHLAYLGAGGTLGYSACPYDAITRTECDTSTTISAVTTAMSAAVEQNIAMALDSENAPHILYYDFTNGDLMHVYGTESSGWTIETIADGNASLGAGQYSAIAIDASDTIHIAYYDVDGTSLQYKQGHAGDDWSLIAPTTIDDSADVDVGKFVAMKLDEATATIHVAYYDATSGTLKYAVSE